MRRYIFLTTLIGFFMNTPVMAAYPTILKIMPVSPPMINVTLPKQDREILLGLEGGMYKVTNNDVHFASTNTQLTPEFFERQTHTVDPEPMWFAHIDLAYFFQGNGRDLQLGYTRMHTNDSLWIHHPVGDQSELVNTMQKAQSHTQNEYDAYDLLLGQTLLFSDRVSLHPFSGIRYVFIKSRDKMDYFHLPAGLVFKNKHYESKFTGVGPRVGSDAEITLGAGFFLKGRIGGAILVGDHDRSSRGIEIRHLSEIYEHTAISHETAVIPELDARLALAYRYVFSKGTAVGMEFGFDTMNYFDIPDKSPLSYTDTAPHKNDFALNGPYIRFELRLV